jgi:hypothetical protein
VKSIKFIGKGRLRFRTDGRRIASSAAPECTRQK